MSRVSNSPHLYTISAVLLTILALVGTGQVSFARQLEQTQQTQQAPSATGSVCVIAYEDVNKNGTRDPGEPLLANVNVSLMVNNVIIENHITDSTDAQKPYCFQNLPAQQYTVTFSSPLAQATTLTTFTFPLGTGEQAQKEFGAVSVTPGSAATDSASSSGGTVWTLPLRLALSTFGALVAMAFIGAVGFILYGLVWKRFRKPRPR